MHKLILGEIRFLVKKKGAREGFLERRGLLSATGPRLGVDLVDRIAPSRLPAVRRSVADQRFEVGPHQLEQKEVPLLPPIEAPHDHASGHGMPRPLHEHEHALAHGLIDHDRRELDLDGHTVQFSDGEDRRRTTIARPADEPLGHGEDLPSEDRGHSDRKHDDGDDEHENLDRIHDASNGLGPGTVTYITFIGLLWPKCFEINA